MVSHFSTKTKLDFEKKIKIPQTAAPMRLIIADYVRLSLRTRDQCKHFSKTGCILSLSPFSSVKELCANATFLYFTLCSKYANPRHRARCPTPSVLHNTHTHQVCATTFLGVKCHGGSNRMEGPIPVQSRLCGCSYLIKFLKRKVQMPR